jgi:hypothetical protein
VVPRDKETYMIMTRLVFLVEPAHLAVILYFPQLLQRVVATARANFNTLEVRVVPAAAARLDIAGLMGQVIRHQQVRLRAITVL